MRFKIGDRVRVRKDLKCNNYYGGVRVNEEMAEYKGKTVTIETTTSSNKGIYEIEEDNGRWCWSGDMFEVAKYDYEDLKKSPIGTKVTFEDGEILIKLQKDYYNECSKHGYYRDEKDLKGLKDNCGSCLLGKIIKIEEPTSYTTVYEAKVEILDEAEKRYLRGVIRPFRNRVSAIRKMRYVSKNKESAYIQIQYKDDAPTNFPCYKDGTMYDGMEADRDYTLEELGL